MRSLPVRKFAFGMVTVAGLAVLILSVFLLWNARQWDYLPLRPADRVDPNVRAQMLQDRIEILTKRVGDMEVLVVALLGLSGLYTIIFVVAAHLSSLNYARQADRSIESIKDHLGLAMGDLRELKAETRTILRRESKAAAARLEQVNADARRLLVSIQEEMQRSVPTYANIEHTLIQVQHRLAGLTNHRPNEAERLELIQCENALAALDLIGAAHLGKSLAPIYRSLGRFYSDQDSTRSRYYLKRALESLPATTEGAAETHYDLACLYSAMARREPTEGSAHFQQAMDELKTAFAHPSKQLEDWLARDIEEGGMLYELASTEPFDKAVNDLLLNVSVGLD